MLSNRDVKTLYQRCLTDGIYRHIDEVVSNDLLTSQYTQSALNADLECNSLLSADVYLNLLSDTEAATAFEESFLQPLTPLPADEVPSEPLPSLDGCEDTCPAVWFRKRLQAYDRRFPGDRLDPRNDKDLRDTVWRLTTHVNAQLSTYYVTVRRRKSSLKLWHFSQPVLWFAMAWTTPLVETLIARLIATKQATYQFLSVISPTLPCLLAIILFLIGLLIEQRVRLKHHSYREGFAAEMVAMATALGAQIALRQERILSVLGRLLETMARLRATHSARENTDQIRCKLTRLSSYCLHLRARAHANNAVVKDQIFNIKIAVRGQRAEALFRGRYFRWGQPGDLLFGLSKRTFVLIGLAIYVALSVATAIFMTERFYAHKLPIETLPAAYWLLAITGMGLISFASAIMKAMALDDHFDDDLDTGVSAGIEASLSAYLKDRQYQATQADIFRRMTELLAERATERAISFTIAHSDL